MNKLFLKAKECLGQELAKKYGSLGCVESLDAVFWRTTGERLIDNPSTYILYLALRKDKRFIEVSKPELGDIILSPTFGGTGKITNGHTGIIGENCIYSNDSLLLIWNNHWTIEKWKEIYVKKGGFLLKFYQYIEKEPPLPPKPIETPNLAIMEQLKVIMEKITVVLREFLKIK